MEINYRDISTIDSFNRAGYTYRKVDRGNGYSVWSVSKDFNGVSKDLGYEVWRDRPVKNPDGSIVIAKPSDEDFGSYAWYYPIRNSKMEAKIAVLAKG